MRRFSVLAFLAASLALSGCQTQPSKFGRYQGEWLWVAVFEDGEPHVGRANFSLRRPGGRGVEDVGVGAWLWCEASGRCLHLEGDQAAMGIYGSERRLALEFSEAAGFTKLLALDLEGAVLADDEEGEGPLIVAGPGRWYFYSGGAEDVGFAMIKLAETPVLVHQGGPRPFAAPDELPLLLARETSEDGAELTRRALELARARLPVP